MNIIFTKLEFNNFLSYENGEYNFINGIDLISGKNGFGKSTINEALFFGLFGKPFRKIKLNSLINKLNTNKLKVILYFNVDERQFKIIRTLKPNSFEIFEFKDNEYSIIKEQASIKDYQTFLEVEILKINDGIFRQLISLSANIPNSKTFMELSSKEKEELFQIITDTSIFNDIKNVISKRVKENKQQLRDYEYNRQLLETSIKSDKLAIQQSEKRNEDFLSHRIENINLTENNIKNAKETIEKYNDAILKLKVLKDLFEELSIKIKDLKEQINNNTIKYNKNIHSIEHIKSAESGAITCKHCNKINYLIEVDISLKDIMINENEVIKTTLIQLKNSLDEENRKSDSIKEKLLNGRRIKENLEELKRNIIFYEKNLIELKEIKPVVIDYSLIESKELDLSNIIDNISIASKNIENLEIIDNLIGDNNIKGSILKSQVSLLNKKINYFLELFSLLEYNFVINEHFQERIITYNDDLEFQSLSNGQKARISFSIMFAFLKLVEERNGVKTNLLILDEILDSSVDSQGRDELLSIIKNEFSFSKNIIIISHNEQIKEKIEIFDRIITIEKDKFSRISFD